MENKNDIQKEQNPDSDILVSKKRPTHAKRDIKEVSDNEKTRIDMPTVTTETVVPKERIKKQEEPLYEEMPLLEEEEPMTKSIFEMLLKGVLYLVFVIAISIIFAYYIITIGNDIFAFKKSGEEVKITIEDTDRAKDIANKLHDAGVIDYPGIFTLYNSFKNRDSETKQEFVADTYVFNADLNYDELIAKFEKSAPVRTIVTITFPEGLSIDEMIDIFLENGIGTREALSMRLRVRLYTI